MKGRIITESIISNFKIYLQNEEKSSNTIEKYIRDVKAFAVYTNNLDVTKEMVIVIFLALLGTGFMLTQNGVVGILRLLILVGLN